MWTRGFPSWGEAQGVEVRGRGGAVRVTQLEKLTGGPPRCKRLEASRVLGSEGLPPPPGGARRSLLAGCAFPW